MTFATKAKIVLASCVLLGLANALILSIIGPAVRRNSQDNPWHSQFVSARALIFRPFILLPVLILGLWAVYWALKLPDNKAQETTKLVVLAVAAISLIGFLLTWVYRT